MSHIVVNKIRRLPIKNPAKAVLWVLADFADDNGFAYPSHSTLALECGITDRTVINCIRQLEELGVVVANRTNGRHTTYKISAESFQNPRTTFTSEPNSPLNNIHPTPEQYSLDPRMSFTPEQYSPVNDVHMTPEQYSPHPRTTFTPPLNDVHTIPHISIIEPSENRERERTLEKLPEFKNPEPVHGRVTWSQTKIAQLPNDWFLDAHTKHPSLTAEYATTSFDRFCDYHTNDRPHVTASDWKMKFLAWIGQDLLKTPKTTQSPVPEKRMTESTPPSASNQISAFSGIELIIFKSLKAKYPELTQRQVRDRAADLGKDVLITMQEMMAESAA